MNIAFARPSVAIIHKSQASLSYAKAHVVATVGAAHIPSIIAFLNDHATIGTTEFPITVFFRIDSLVRTRALRNAQRNRAAKSVRDDTVVIRGFKASPTVTFICSIKQVANRLRLAVSNRLTASRI